MKSSASAKKVVLIGDDHTDGSHMSDVMNYLTRKVQYHPKTLLGLETDPLEQPLILGQQPSSRSGRAPRSKNITNALSKRIDQIPMLHHTTPYREGLQMLSRNIPSQHQMFVSGVDDANLADNNQAAFTTRRDQAMYKNIMDIMQSEGIDRAYYPVGSAHIFNGDANDPDPQLGKRLGSLLANTPNIRLKLKNFYPQSSLGYNTVKQDIDAFNNYHPQYQNQPLSPPPNPSLPSLPSVRRRKQKVPIPTPTKKLKKASGGYVSGNSSYDPYLNTYNYAEPLRLSEYLIDQTPRSEYDYDTGSYDDPYMSYGNAYDDDGQQYSFKEGGSVKEEDLPRLADLISRYGRGGDTELAHINPIEAHILKSLGGSGTINPATGLREYNPFKAIKSVLGGGAGAIIGNMIAPGIGGIIGGAIGQGAQHAARGKSALSGALKGAGMGAALPSVASGLGWGASKLGATALGSSLSNYGSTNAILPALGMGSSSGSSGLFGLGGSNPYVSGGLSAATALSSGMGGVPPQYGQYPQMQYPGYPYVDNRGFLEKFGDNFSDYLSKPSNLLTLGTTAAQYLGREKPKSPEQIGNEERRKRNASRKTIAEIEADEALETARADLQKKRKNKQLEEDIKNMGSVKRHVVSPEEFARTGRWLEYEDDEGRPVRMKSGGLMRSPYDYLVEEVSYPTASPLHYLNGDSGGQDDLIDAKLSDGEYVFDASTVSDLGDGNNAAGARKLDVFRENIRKHKRGGKVNLPPRSKSLESYLRG